MTRLTVKILVAVVFFFTSIFAVSFLLGWISPPMQTDDELAARFLKERRSFEILADSFAGDSTLLFASNSKFYRNHGGGLVTESKPSDLHLIALRKTGVLSGYRGGVLDIEFLSFPTYRIELDGGDLSQTNFEEKGYAFMLSATGKVDEILADGGTYGNFDFRRIEGQWYIYRGIRVSKPE